MYFAYLDDSRPKHAKWQVMSAVIIDDKQFTMTEKIMSATQHRCLSQEKWARFEEFHASDLYGGYGLFEGMPPYRRWDAIRRLLLILRGRSLVVYGAVELQKLHQNMNESADPLDICFRICLKGIQSWADQRIQCELRATLGNDLENYTIDQIASEVVNRGIGDLILLIADECDKKTKQTLQKSFRSVRPKWRPPATPFHFFHDDMYFGDSRYSVGIQLADLCSYFIGRHLEGPSDSDHFYEMIQPNIVHSGVYLPLSEETPMPSQDTAG